MKLPWGEKAILKGLVREVGKIEPERPAITPEMFQLTMRALEAKGLIYYRGGEVYIPTEGGWKLLMEIGPSREEIVAYGHPNITATHKTTMEITKAGELGKDADCIIGVAANKSCVDLNKEFRDSLKNGKKIFVTIEAGGIDDDFVAFGSPALVMSHTENIVIRKSDFIDSRTLAILADKAAVDLDRDLVKKLKDPKTMIKITLEIKG